MAQRDPLAHGKSELLVQRADTKVRQFSGMDWRVHLVLPTHTRESMTLWLTIVQRKCCYFFHFVANSLVGATVSYRESWTFPSVSAGTLESAFFTVFSRTEVATTESAKVIREDELTSQEECSLLECQLFGPLSRVSGHRDRASFSQLCVVCCCVLWHRPTVVYTKFVRVHWSQAHICGSLTVLSS